MSVEASIDVKTMDKEVKTDDVPDVQNEESFDNIEKYYAYVVTMDEEV